MFEQARRRHEELIEVSAQARRRRQQVQRDRERIRAQMALRRSFVVTADRRAAAAILEAAFRVTGLALEELWLDYFALGGDVAPSRLEEMMAGEAVLSRADHDRLAVALNERLAHAGWGRPLAYWDGSR